VTAFLDTDVLIDCLRGTSSAQEWLAHSARLYTFNLRHFRAVPGLDAQAPYART
jgi:predicted nucleic acid-binding protein